MHFVTNRRAWRDRAAKTSARLVGLLFVVLVVTYSLTWTRIVSPGGQAFPIQRIIATVFVASVVLLWVLRLAERRRSRGSVAALRVSLVGVLLLAWAFVSTASNLAAERFQAAPAVMDASKYAVNVLTFIAVIYVIRVGILTYRQLVTAVMWSLAIAVLLSLVPLVLYLFGFTFIDGLFLRTFGAAWGVWPSSGLIPRVVGPTAEPQQLSIAFMMALLVATQQKGRIPLILTILGILVLLFSQSKFALLSILVVVGVGVATYRRQAWATRCRRMLTVVAGGASLLVMVAAAVALPTFQESLQKGVKAEAFTERAQNAALLMRAAQAHPIFGIGPGQYGSFRSYELAIPPDNSYYPNNDYLKVFAELGLPGLALLLVLLIAVITTGVRAVLLVRRTGERDLTTLTWASLLATGLILANMAIGYELLHVFFWISAGVLVGLHCRQLDALAGRSGEALGRRLRPKVRQPKPELVVANR